jgi:hypothetical protein
MFLKVLVLRLLSPDELVEFFYFIQVASKTKLGSKLLENRFACVLVSSIAQSLVRYLSLAECI